MSPEVTEILQVVNRYKRKSRHVRNCYFSILRDKSRFSRLPRQITILVTISDFFKFIATNRAVSFKSGDRIRVFNFKSAGEISRSLSISIWDQLRPQPSEWRYGLRKSKKCIRLIMIRVA